MTKKRDIPEKLGPSNGFQTVIPGSKYVADGEYMLTNGNITDIISSDFKTEKEICEFIEYNFERFCTDILNDKLLNFYREFNLIRHKRHGNKRVDFYIECVKKAYLIEVKKPRHTFEASYAIGQLLVYLSNCRLIGLHIDEVILLTTRMDMELAWAIKEFKLPITVIILSKTCALTTKPNGTE